MGSHLLSLLSPSPITPEEHSSWVASRDGENLSCFYLVGNLTEIPTPRCIFFSHKKLNLSLFFFFFICFLQKTNKRGRSKGPQTLRPPQINRFELSFSICARVAVVFSLSSPTSAVKVYCQQGQAATTQGHPDEVHIWQLGSWCLTWSCHSDN